jgi:cell division protein FtsZ
MAEINDAANVIIESIDPDAQVIFGAVINEKLTDGELQVTVIATGFDQKDIKPPIKPFKTEEVKEPTLEELQKQVEAEKIKQKEEEERQKAVEVKKDEFIKTVDSDGEDEFELPTFIRNKLNKK